MTRIKLLPSTGTAVFRFAVEAPRFLTAAAALAGVLATFSAGAAVVGGQRVSSRALLQSECGVRYCAKSQLGVFIIMRGIRMLVAFNRR